MSPSTRIIVPLLLPLVWALSPMVHADSADAGAGDQPDLKREKKFFNIYSNFNQEPTSDETWSGATTGKAQGYTVQKGDTLWSVSETLFGDPQFWPKIWSLNSESIENPHEIRPSQEVKFVPGSMGEAPSMAVTEAGEEKETVEAEAPPKAEASPEKAEPAKDPLADVPLPEPAKKHPAVSGIPSSLPAWAYRQDHRHDVQMDVQKIDRKFTPGDEPLTYFLADQETQGVGKIVETELTLSSAAEFQYVVIKLPAVPSTKKLLVVRDIGEVKDPVSKNWGTVVQVQGEIEVLESVNAEEHLYRALVKRALGPVEVGAQLVAGDLPVFNPRDEGTVGAANARIIGGQHNLKRFIFGTSNLVFLGGQGLVVGQSYPIYKIQELRNDDTDEIQNPREIGRVKVVKASQNFATGVVISATAEIQVGDVTDPQLKK